MAFAAEFTRGPNGVILGSLPHVQGEAMGGVGSGRISLNLVIHHPRGTWTGRCEETWETQVGQVAAGSL